ncbi:hypothetical protein BDV19DRAFT_390700 [Aspergillus venezuelensis]
MAAHITTQDDLSREAEYEISRIRDFEKLCLDRFHAKSNPVPSGVSDDVPTLDEYMGDHPSDIETTNDFASSSYSNDDDISSGYSSSDSSSGSNGSGTFDYADVEGVEVPAAGTSGTSSASSGDGGDFNDSETSYSDSLEDNEYVVGMLSPSVFRSIVGAAGVLAVALAL